MRIPFWPFGKTASLVWKDNFILPSLVMGLGAALTLLVYDLTDGYQHVQQRHTYDRAVDIGLCTIHANLTPVAVLALGFLVSFLLSAITWNTCTLRKRATKLAERMSADLARKERHYASVLQTTGGIIAVLSREFRVLEWNKAAEVLLGYSRNELAGLDALELLVLPESREVVRQKMMALVPGEAIQNQEVPILTKDGQNKICLVNITCLNADDGQSADFVVAALDVTDRKAAEAAIAEREEMFRCISTGAHDAIVMIDHQGQVSFWNEAAQAILGYRADEVMGSNLHDFFLPTRYRESYRAAFPRWQTTGRGNAIGKTVEITALHKSGEEVSVELSLASVKVRGNWQAVGIMRDITARKLAEEDMRRAKEAADQASKAKSEFLANMSHEIRTPMNGIIGMTSLALETNLDDEQRTCLQMVQASAEALLRIVNDILDFSKVEAGKLELVKEQFDLRELIEEKANILRARSEERSVLVHVDPSLPEVFVGDRLRMGQILDNLMGNSLKFTASTGAVVVYAFLEAGPDGQLLHVAVADNGVGIPENKLSCIFDSFTQADSSVTRRHGGTGLGLTICKKLVSLMGGTIWVKSKFGLGSAFHVCIPWLEAAGATQGPHGRASKPVPAAEPCATKPPAGGKRILVAEDNLINQKLMTHMLRKLGHQVVVAENGSAAVERVMHERFDLILMDCQMPVMSGYEATKLIRDYEKQQGTRVPIVAITAHAMQGDGDRCLESGMDDYLAKPFQVRDLKNILNKWLVR